jgi:excisionase family DNA binding protein
MMLSLKQAALALGVSVSTIRRLVTEHRLEYLKIGRRTLIESSEVERYIQSLRGEK